MKTMRMTARATAVLVASTVATGSLVLGGPAVATTATVGENPSPTYQTNGRVYAIISVGSKIYIGGSFTSVRPAGSPPGTGDVTRDRLAAFSASSGQLLSWSPRVNSTVNALAASPNGRVIYVGGKFGRLGGETRHNLGAVRAGNGKTTHFRADTDRRVLALATAGSRVYVGGKITKIHGKSRSRLAAVSDKGRVLRSWHPSANRHVRTIAVSHKNVFIGGDFTRVSGKKQRHLAKLDVKRGRLRSFKSHPSYPVDQIVATRKNLFLAGNGAGGHAASYTAGGRFRWVKQTDGAVHSVGYLGGVVYVGGQFTNVCVGNTSHNMSHFKCPQVLAQRRHLTALAQGNGSVLPWNPGTDSIDGVFAMAAASGSIRIGGDFTTVHGVSQQGYASFPPPA
jgi:hypothetical protein